ncbi:outer membrane beta-barrel protein [Sediminibacterium soli]|uniref:outer membrane beta-barrel protein n=1 Tax=Sediminibacterium soli TaxID=2698829 RepID=UPI00137B37F7|nr:outer membrane beta-barrel protein [Sediminibacterium soli]NCI48275.1 PorT family protein [Sediminibacterium soli]
MKKTLLAALGLVFSVMALAQNDSARKSPVRIDLGNRAADHFMIQFGGDSWTGRPDSIRTTGFSRHFNVYFMLDRPFKTNPKFSVAFGIGIGSSNMFFKNTRVDIRSTSSRLPFTNVDSTDHYKKYKVTNIYAEIPVELRYYSNPANTNRSWKLALGVKVGTLLKTYTKGKDLVNKSGTSIYGPTYIAKESNKRFFNGTMLALTGRIGYGFVSLDAGYQFNNVLKEGTGPGMHKFSLGLTFSGL